MLNGTTPEERFPATIRVPAGYYWVKYDGDLSRPAEIAQWDGRRWHLIGTADPPVEPVSIFTERVEPPDEPPETILVMLALSQVQTSLAMRMCGWRDCDGSHRLDSGHCADCPIADLKPLWDRIGKPRT